MAETKSDTLAGAADDMKQKASEAVDSAKAEATRRVEGAKYSIADEISGVASALRRASGEFDDGSPQARTFSQFADGLNNASEALRGKSLGDMVSGLNGFARRNPAAFLGGAALLGFAASRFAKASEHADTEGASAPRPTISAPPVAASAASTAPGTGSGYSEYKQ